jgi:hypothetical protein
MSNSEPQQENNMNTFPDYVSKTYWNGESKLPVSVDISDTVSTVQGLQAQIAGLAGVKVGLVFVAIPDADAPAGVSLVKMSVDLEEVSQ